MWCLEAHHYFLETNKLGCLFLLFGIDNPNKNDCNIIVTQ
jgi:hypothetical protein